MVWGYERSFTIEHDTTVKRRIDCKDCLYYDSSDKSCMKRPLYLPEDGYNSWRKCQYFGLDRSTSHYDEKQKQYTEFLVQKRRAERLGTESIKNEKIIESSWLKPDSRIFHKVFGGGKIISKNEKYIKVRFDSIPNEIRQFSIKVCIDKGLIKPE